MNRGLLQTILTQRYGVPNINSTAKPTEYRWFAKNERANSILYVGMDWERDYATRFGSLKGIYGECIGGFLIGDSLKVALLIPQNIFGLYYIEELRNQPEVRHALELDPRIDFFMDAANVWFYGHKEGELYVFDGETAELDALGPMEQGLITLLDEWEMKEE